MKEDFVHKWCEFCHDITAHMIRGFEGEDGNRRLECLSCGEEIEE